MQAAIPADTTPAARVRLLNLLSRIELYRMQVDHAEKHAQQALALAAQHDDLVGQGEADLNLALAAISKGTLSEQDERISHGLPLLQNSNRPDLLSEIMAMAAMMYRRNGLLSEAAEMALRAQEMARASKDAVALAYAEMGMAQVYVQSRQDAEAKECFQRMSEQARIAGRRRLEAMALVGLARISTRQGNTQEAWRLINTAIDIDTRAGIPSALGADLFALAENQRRQGKMQEAIQTLDKVAGIYRTYPHKSGLWWALYTRSEFLEVAGRSGETDAEQALQLAKELGLPFYLNKSTKRLADIAASHGNWKRAYQYSDMAVSGLEQLGNDESGQHISKVARQFEASRQQRRVDALAHDNERQQARQRWMMTLLGGSGIILAGLLAFLVYQKRSHRLLMESHRQLQLSRDDLRESERRLFNVATHIPGFIYTFHQSPDGHFSFPFASPGIRDLYDLAPEDVRDDMTILHMRMHPEDRPMIESAIAKSGASLSLLFVEARVSHPAKGEIWVEMRSTPERLSDGSTEWHGIMLDITERKRMESLLRESQSMLRALAERNETIREAERRHLAREVHDELGQILNAIRLNLMTLDIKFCQGNPEMREMVGRMIANLNSSIGMARNIVAALYPTVLDAGIAAALEWLIKEFGKNTGIICDLLVEEDIALDVMQTIAVYRIVQESLTNVARHSGAKRVDVSLVRDDDMCQLEIIDDGRGFDVFRPRSHKSLGLIAMKERAIMLGGSARLISEPGSGASLRIDFPLQRPGADTKSG